MKFYNRELELGLLRKNWDKSQHHSVMTTVMGRRRVGKTSLLLRSVEGIENLYLYVSKDNEQMLCRKFQEQAASALGIEIHGQTTRISEMFETLMRHGIHHRYTLIIDEFQNFLSINNAIPSHIQDIWDRYKDSTHINLILCGSIYSMMHKIFDNGDAPLYGRRDSHLRLLPFSIATLKTILHDHHADYRPDDLLCLYMLTGGVAKYVELLMDNGAVTKQRMLHYALSADSPFLTEGTEILLSEFGRDYGTYFSILQLIAGGMTTQAEIDSVIAKNTGAYLNNLYEDYTFVSKSTPLLNKVGSRNIRWHINDPFLRFWFRFVYPYQGLVESNQIGMLRQYVADNYSQFSGRTLELYFQELYMQSGRFTHVGNWWDRRGENEIELLALNEFNKTGVIAEVKRNANKLNIETLSAKVAALPSEFSRYQFPLRLLSLEDM